MVRARLTVPALSRSRIPAVRAPRVIVHVDLDAFYASVEQLRRPELRGRPVIVGGAGEGPGGGGLRRGVVCAASYEVRKFGVRSAMPLLTALRLCPHAVVLPVDFPAYRAASAAVFALVAEVTPDVEPLSLDEAYLDVTGSVDRLGGPAAIAARLRDRIGGHTGLDASIGVAGCKVVAKVASDLRKPRGLVVVPVGEEARFLAPLPLRALPGLGANAERALGGLGVTRLGQLASLPVEIVCRRLGARAGRHLWERAQGIDPSPVAVAEIPRSISREETFAADEASPQILTGRLRELAGDVGRRLRSGGWLARTVIVKLRYNDFTTLTRQASLAVPSDGDNTLAAAGLRLFAKTWSGAPLRLLGVAAGGMGATAQLDLFSPPAERDDRLDRTLDQLRERFGRQAVRRGVDPALRDLDFRGDDLRRLVRRGPDLPG